MTDPDFQAENKKLSSDFGHGFDMWSGEHIAKVKRNEAVEGRHVYITSEWVPRGDKLQYESFVYFLPRGSTPEHPALAGFVYDEDYLKNSFFPQALNEVLPNQNRNDHVPSTTGDHDSQGKRPGSFGCFGLLGWRGARSGAWLR